MSRSCSLLLALTLTGPALTLTGPVAAETDRPAVKPAAPITADALIARNLTAKGGRERLLAVASARATGQVTLSDGVTAPFVWEWRTPNLVRMEFTTADGPAVQAFDGATAWQASPRRNAGKPERMTKEMTDLFALEADFVGPLLDYAAKGHQVALVEPASLPGGTHGLRVTLKTGHILDIRIDPNTFLERSQTMTVTANGGPLRIEVTLADYRTVDGIVVPFLIRSHVAGTGTAQTLTFGTLTLGAKIDLGRFRMPVDPPATAPK